MQKKSRVIHAYRQLETPSLPQGNASATGRCRNRLPAPVAAERSGVAARPASSAATAAAATTSPAATTTAAAGVANHLCETGVDLLVGLLEDLYEVAGLF